MTPQTRPFSLATTETWWVVYYLDTGQSISWRLRL